MKGHPMKIPSEWVLDAPVNLGIDLPARLAAPSFFLRAELVLAA